MLLCFPGELTNRFLLWLREPPMATAEMLFRIYPSCFVPKTVSQVSPLRLLLTARLATRAPRCAASNSAFVII